ncbi:uncharacterized protein LOC120012486 [Tripterygium wilfordii]|uniref:uncharacterized protein LOC120012486 n=1 Tax=Tripterygium wilfordii TaxID=458696 RepID=UPI0018F838D6|nr:uncharacterized protein LOC120012486 [Tripterygium wilfordii]
MLGIGQQSLKHTDITTKQSPTTEFPSKRIITEEVQEKKLKGLCFYCDEKFIRGHKCAKKLELSACAFYDISVDQTSKTMKVNGLTRDHPVLILIDSGSTLNFVDSILIKKLGWQFAKTKEFEVSIADGGKVRGMGCCVASPLGIGNYNCTTNLFVLPPDGYDVILGVQWLSTISPVLWDFQLFTM